MFWLSYLTRKEEKPFEYRLNVIIRYAMLEILFFIPLIPIKVMP